MFPHEVLAEGRREGTASDRNPLVDSKMEQGQFKEFSILDEQWGSESEKKNWILICMLKGGTQRMRECSIYTQKKGVCLLMVSPHCLSREETV